MTDEKELLKITTSGGLSGVLFQCSGKEELQIVALGLYSIFHDHPEILDMIQIVSFLMATDKELADKYEECKVEAPDFDKLLNQK